MDPIEDRSTWDYIYHAMFSEALLTDVFVESCDKNIAIKNLHEYFNLIDKSDENFGNRYIVDCILKRFDKSDLNFNEEIVLYFLNRSKDQIVRALLPYLNSNQANYNFSDKEKHNIAFFLLAFKDTYPGAYKILYNKFRQLINAVTLETLYDSVGQESFWLLQEAPISFFNSFRIDNEVVFDLFKIPLFYTDINVTHALQKRLTNLYLYPNPFPKIPDLAFSCMNTVINLNTHFMDVMNQMAIEYLTSGDYNLMISNFKLFQTTIPYFLVAHKDLVYKDLQNIVPLLSENFPPSWASQLVARFRNDYKLLELIQFLNNKDKTPDLEILLKNSIPFLIQNAIGNAEILNYGKVRYFTVSDRAAKADFDFLRSYTAFRYFFSILTSPPTYASKFIEQINDVLSTIQNPKILDSVCIDLFSLLFMKKDGNFMLTTSTVRMLVKVLNNYSTNQYIANANAMFQKIPFWQREPQFHSFFERNPSDIYEAILSQRWDKADMLTQGLPLYRKFFLLSNAMYNKLNDQDFSEESLKYKEIIDLEFEFTKSQKINLRGFIDKFPEYKDIIEKRMQSEDPIDILNKTQVRKALYDCEQFYNVIDLEPILEDLKKHSMLYEFSNYLNEYRHVTNMIKIDIPKAIMTSYKSGNLKFAEKICKMAGKSIMEVILENSSDFELDEDFVLKNFNEYKLEMIVLCITQINPSILMKLPDIPKEILSYISPHFDLQNRSNDFKKLIQIIETGEDEFIDDILFNVNHRQVLKYLLDNKEILKFTKTVYNVLNVVEYTTENEEERNQIINIKINFVIDNFTKSDGSENDIVNVLTEKLSKEIALQYLINKNENCQYLTVENLFDKYKEEDEFFLVKIVKSFPKYFRQLLTKFTRFTKVFEISATPQNRDILNAFKLLPSQILNECQTIDRISILNALEKLPSEIFALKKEITYFLADDDFTDLINRMSDFTMKCKVVRFLQEFYSESQNLSIVVEKIVKDTVKSIYINSIESENSAVLTLQTAMTIAEGEQHKLVEILLNLVRSGLFAVHKISYNFSGLDEENFGDYLMEISIKSDIYDVGNEICDLCHLSSDKMNFQISFLLLRLGLYNDAKKINFTKTTRLENFEYKGWHQNQSPFLDTTALFIMPLMKATIAPPSLAPSLLQLSLPIKEEDIQKIDSQNVYLCLKNLSQRFIEKRKSKPGLPITRTDDDKKRLELIMHAKYFVMRYYDISNTLSILMMMQCIGDAYQTLFLIENEEEKVNLFANYFYLPAFCTLNFGNEFEKFMKTNDPNFALTNKMWNGLIEYLKEMSMYENLAFVYCFREMYAEESIARLNLFSTATSFTQSYNLTSNALLSLDNALKSQKGRSNYSYDELQESYNLVSIQHHFFQFLFENRKLMISLNETEGIDIIHNPQSGAKMAAILLLEGHETESLYKDIISTTGVDDNQLVKALAEIIKGFEPMKATDLLSKMKKKKNHRRLVPLIIRKILPELALSKYSMNIPAFIMMVDDLKLRALLFIEYDCLGEATELVHMEKMTDLITLIAYRASQTGRDLIILNYVK
ncbi:hypothetical protein TVAG_475480 [Trichomonas vaginalis G3]|uniref:Uncharacterized protein n=1 Tax=Trichomonas vaginalis (strain ATCC PRA-98 / G3) TaxID=412133 RepID=A2D9X2_TRIV3|nr:hypothetical protein TVAGG3_0265350 [Trichomonas vaginalis G3]EAY22620.1 hypothetical protein TVAG_475480 [Trichomonas vaginalis G3]KAI5525429.1 hypothetical protein TVAGG3_0265350 [Trichomonas vaginalis G3]|eukprot:XP_001583606.1 hypothetical protein [Trichomonas vaginalis G3]